MWLVFFVVCLGDRQIVGSFFVPLSSINVCKSIKAGSFDFVLYQADEFAFGWYIPERIMI